MGRWKRLLKQFVMYPSVDDIDISNLLSRTADSTGLVIVKLKRKLEYGGHILLHGS